jgi:hypothetical protein
MGHAAFLLGLSTVCNYHNRKEKLSAAQKKEQG